MSGFTKVPNHILDSMADLKPASFKLAMALCRLTYGYHRDSVQISLRKLEGITGLSRQGIINASNEIGHIFTSNKNGIGTVWVVNTFDQYRSTECTGGQQSVPDRSTHLTSNGQQSVPIYRSAKESKENNKESKSPPDSVATDSVINPIIDALKPIVSETYTNSRHVKFDETALTLFGWDATTKQIAAFGQWWKDNGWHNDKPALNNVIDSWDSFKSKKSKLEVKGI